MTSTARDHYNQGILQKKRYLYTDALASFEAALAIEPENHEFLMARGNMLYALERYQEALDSYRKAESLAGVRHRGLLLAISSTLAALGRHQESVQVYEEGMQAPRA
ncbi:tetratricopeptide repeat protein [Methanosphaerula palustris]|uniref:tetratricopeptide repeat protein n=1 Tax=Methanosphaerula palustris TaxID=475088 RepID=UPI00018488F1|nr:tetratricopeptide repeat protein [Methanosphaerula palustris]